MGTKATRRKAAVHYAVHTLSRGNLTNLMPRSFTFVCQLCCCSSKHNNNNNTFNSCKTVSTSSMALATVNIDKITKVTSASSYVLCYVLLTYYWIVGISQMTIGYSYLIRKIRKEEKKRGENSIMCRMHRYCVTINCFFTNLAKWEEIKKGWLFKPRAMTNAM